MTTITNAPFLPAGDTFQDHVSMKTQRQVPNNTDSAYLTILASWFSVSDLQQHKWEIAEQVRVEAEVNVGWQNWISYKV